MTISSTTVKNSYSGNGSTTAFAYTFKIFANTDLQVIIRSSTGTETVKTLTTHYTVSGVGDASGGNVTFTSGNTPASGETVVIRRAVPQTQAIDYIANDPFPAESHEEGLDRATMTTQQVQEELDRAIKLSRTNTITSTEFTTSATDRANKVLSFDSSGELAVAQELGTFKGNWSSDTAYVVRDLVKDTSTNNIFIVNTAHTSSGSQPLTTNANSAKYDLIVDAASATTSATNAASSATAAASSATSSASSASSASTQASNASTSASNAASSATAAAASATSAANSADAFDDVYLGSKSSDPTTDNDGDALAAGMLYFNTTTDLLRVYSGSAWQNAAVDTTNFITLTGTQTLTNKTLTSPKIGTSILDTNGNELAKITATSSAVNELTVANAATGNGPTISVTGDDSNVDLDLLAKGTGHVTVRGNTNSGAIQLNCEANTHGQQIKAQPHSAGVTNSMLLPAGADSTLVSLVSTDTLTNKTLTSPQIGTKISDTNGNELLKVTATSSAVNELTLANAATGNNPSFTASGDDTNIGVSILPKGSGQVTIDNLTFPAADGSADQVLKTDGSGNLSFTTISGGGTSWQAVKTSNFNAAAGEGYFVDTSSSAITATLPASPSIGDSFEFKDYAQSFATNNLTIDPNGNKFEGLNDANHIAQQNRQSVTITFSDSTKGYVLTSSANSTASENSGLFNIVAPPYTADFVVVAGGGGGNGGFGAGGGGAGGYRASYNSEASGGGGSSESSLSLSPGNVYTVTIGAGGNTGKGSDSSVSGSGITTVTSVGGGKGGASDGTENGGSGGGDAGGSGDGSGGTGTANQGFAGGNGQQGGGYQSGGGGGGAAQVGGNSSGPNGNPGGGGNGVASTITGSSVTRAGGGGGGQQNHSPGASSSSGGTGGGGDGAKTGSAGTGTANTGGGGGGAEHGGAAGGSGVVILRVPAANFTNTTTGSPTVSDDGSDKVMVFTGSGSYTA